MYGVCKAWKGQFIITATFKHTDHSQRFLHGHETHFQRIKREIIEIKK